MVNVSKVSSKQPKSNTCQQPLDAATDRNKYGGRYFKNCVACRSVATSRKKQLRQQRQEAIAQGTSAAGAADPVPTEQACASCRENVPVDRLVRLKACQHNPQTCEDCFAGWVNAQIQSQSWDQIRCPAGCNGIVSHDDVKAHAPADVFRRYDELAMRSALSEMPDFRHCLRPGCPSGQLHNSGTEGNIFICSACGFKVCTVHDAAMHTGETCAQYDQRIRDQQRGYKKSEKTIKDTTKRCPGRKCGVPIEKNDGCDHMTCRRCGFQFCWICLAPYDGPRGVRAIGNRAHARDCSYHQ